MIANLPELVAPAGSAESLEMALKFGADAVYLGLGRFNARMKAGNFELSRLKETAGFIHSKGAKMYVAFNTLIKQSELLESCHGDGGVDNLSAAEMAVQSLRDGADAIILQDLGLLKAVKALEPAAVIHASTQMGIHNVEGALAVKVMGVSRVILSREVPLDDIAEIKRKTGLELEVFVQGALCVSFSGNCYFSSLVSGYSGNRGMCMQLCRKKYKALEGGREISNGYLLSPRDLCLAKDIQKLIEAGVDSFKIEGRMRRPEYVGEAVRVYRKAISGAVGKEDIDALKSVYNRGDYTTGYLFGADSRTLIEPKLQGHKGLYAGDVIKTGAGGVLTAKIARGVVKGDGFKVLRDGYEAGSAEAFETQSGGECRLRYKGNLKPGDCLHITTDIRQIERLNGS